MAAKMPWCAATLGYILTTKNNGARRRDTRREVVMRWNGSRNDKGCEKGDAYLLQEPVVEASDGRNY